MSPGRSLVTSHVLDTARGVPAAGVVVRLERAGGPGEGAAAQEGAGDSGPSAAEIARARTDQDGRVNDLGPARLPPGSYRLVFETGEYLAGRDGQAGFFPEVAVTFVIDGVASHYHVPLLLSPFAYSTYRGS
jgi:5-hydroxyisourate hydrolase